MSRTPTPPEQDLHERDQSGCVPCSRVGSSCSVVQLQLLAFALAVALHFLPLCHKFRCRANGVVRKWGRTDLIREERIWAIAVRRGSYKTLFLLNSGRFSLENREIQF